MQNIKLAYEILLNHFLVPAVVDLDDLLDFKLQDLAFVFYLGLSIKKVKHYSPSAPFIGEENSDVNTMKLKIHTLDCRLNRLDSIAQRISVGFSIMSDRNSQNSEEQNANQSSVFTEEALMSQLQFLQTRVSHLMDTVVNQSKLVNDVINRQQLMASEYRSQNASSIPEESELDDSQIRAEYTKLRTKCLDLMSMNHELTNESQSYRKSNEELSMVITKIASTRPVIIDKDHNYKKDRAKRHSMKAEDFRKYYKGEDHEDPPLRAERKEKSKDKDSEVDGESKRKRYARRKTSSSFNLSRLSKQKADRNSFEELSHSEPGPSLEVSKTSSAGDSPDKGPSISFNIPQERSKISASVTMDDLSERAKKFDREKDAPRLRSFSNRLDAPPKVAKQNTLHMDYDSD